MTIESRAGRHAKVSAKKNLIDFSKIAAQSVPRRYLTVQEGAAYLGNVSTAYIWKIASHGELALIRIGRRTMVEIADLDALAQRNKSLRLVAP